MIFGWPEQTEITINIQFDVNSSEAEKNNSQSTEYRTYNLHEDKRVLLLILKQFAVLLANPSLVVLFLHFKNNHKTISSKTVALHKKNDRNKMYHVNGIPMYC